MSTKEPIMSTILNNDNIAATLFGKTRRTVLALLFSHVDKRFYFRQIVSTTGAGLGALQRELKNLTDAGIIQKTILGRQVYYQANPVCPIFTELKSLVMKTVGIGDALRAALAPLEDRIIVAFLFGSVAKGNEHSNSDVDILFIARIIFAEVTSALSRVQETIRREINPIVYPPEEFRSKLAADHHFLKSIMEGPKYFLIGDEHELAKLVK
jgi:predicted nucleotidyltransferase